MGLILINTLMSLSIACFYIGYFFRKKNNVLHQRINTLGVVFNLSAAVFLLAVKYALGGLESYGIFPAVDRWIIDTHRAFAISCLVLMLVMAFTGFKRIRTLHVPLHFFFLPLYTVVYVSGLLIFRTTPLVEVAR